jgi:hypothetical protein
MILDDDIPAPLPEEMVTEEEAALAWAQGVALLRAIHEEENAKKSNETS